MTTDNRNKLSVILKALVRDKRTGLLSIQGHNGFQAGIYLDKGAVVMVEDGKLYGAPAAKHIAKRMDLATEFHEDQVPHKTVPINFTAAEVIGLMEKAESAFDTFSRIVPSLNAVFALNRDSWGKEEVNPKDLQILIQLDGRRMVREVIAESGLPELDILHTIYRYHARGLIKRIAGAKLLPADVCRRLLEDLQEHLADIIGPAAETILEEALQATHVSPDQMSEGELPNLMDAVRRHLDDEECATFNAWAIDKGYVAS